MSYDYNVERENVFTEDGQVMFLSVRDNVNRLISDSGAVSMQCAISGQTGNSWHMLACVDRLVELKEIREITGKNVAGQDRVFVK